jgi:hypothetical protein
MNKIAKQPEKEAHLTTEDLVGGAAAAGVPTVFSPM